MSSGDLNLRASREHARALRADAERSRFGDTAHTPVTRVTLRRASAADTERLRVLAELESAPVPEGPSLVADIDGRLRAALPLDGGAPIADRCHGGAELLELLRLRASQLA